MTPTIVLKDGKFWFALGSPGGPTIINTVTQSIINVIDHGMNIQQAIDWPRFHHQWMPDEIRWEPFGISPDTMQKLISMGHKFSERSGNMGDCEGVMIEDRTGVRLGGNDSRANGKSVGY